MRRRIDMKIDLAVKPGDNFDLFWGPFNKWFKESTWPCYIFMPVDDYHYSPNLYFKIK